MTTNIRTDRSVHSRTSVITRLAVVSDVDAIWNLYRCTGFLCPDKLAAMGDGGNQARETFTRLLGMQSSAYRVAVAEDSEGIRGVCTSALFTEKQAWVMHLASDRNRQAVLQSIVSACNQTICANPDWVSYTFRENNQSVRKLFTSAIGRSALLTECEVHRYFFVDTEHSQRILRRSGSSIIVRNADDHDCAVRQLALSTAERAALCAVGTIDLSRCRTACQLRANGLPRDRVAYIGESGHDWILTICDLAPEWWNFSELSSGVQLFGALDNEDLVWAALSRAAAWFRSHGRERWTLLARITGDRDPIGRCLSQAGCDQVKAYRRIGVPRALIADFTTAYARFIARGGAIPAIGAEALACT